MDSLEKLLVSVTTLCLLAFSIAGCAGQPSSSQAELRLYVFDCGVIELADVTSFGLTNDQTEVRELFVPCYLIEHEQGRMLWDAGLPLPMAGLGRHEAQPGIFVDYRRSLIQQLEDLQLSPTDIDLLALSHFHFDHAGAANAFSDATLLIQRAEYEAAFLHTQDYPVFEDSLYSELRDSKRLILDGDHDVFGDGSVRIINAPGHTPGHQTLLLDLPQTGRIMLSGDLYHFEKSRELKATPVFNTDAAQTLRSMDKVERLLREENATLWIEHNKALADGLRKAPAYYN